ncbi:beta-ketoacyl synthase N-terminal-like domain-containing protein [Spirosoma sordidisoli]|uniref:Beta-ketoacyl synthase n=1 Tax=Spirosoma sordidisoli TaxID=2502893 RepID=A0A4Q2ULS4_9BACT|nr:beta-ketoacyl synthase N-terminal-like domain-containing protein [Spirosoma sordidisoli]RYC68455.1 beta-ketoacyl synthase [Spirosoma sordidisoli]
MNRTYVVASGVASPLGFDTPTTFEALIAGQTGLRVRQPASSAGPVCTAEVDGSLLARACSDRLLTRGTPATKLEQMGLVALHAALHDTTLSWQQADTLLIVCSAKGNIPALAEAVAAEPPGQQEYMARLAQSWASAWGLCNEPMVLSNACISSLHGIVVARRLIGQGLFRHVIVIGADVVSDFTRAGFQGFNAVSAEPCRPFDAARRGINLGEAAAVLVLSADDRLSVGVELRGGVVTNDAHHISAPSRTGEGLFRAIERVRAGRTPDFISLHGTATVYNDEMEAQALNRANLLDCPVYSLKGQLGHTLGAAGVLESVLAIESLRRNQLLASHQYATPGTTYPLRVVERPETRPLQTCLKTSSGFGGCNAAVWYEKTN